MVANTPATLTWNTSSNSSGSLHMRGTTIVFALSSVEWLPCLTADGTLLLRAVNEQ